ncbi:MAG: Gfo/Idh/MocA family oxidoreductase [Oscillospiraceae bacterium]|nr:Gfo/Idh/MocA family oxidoreductase [Oscillospiraceae bacterium]
MKVSIIGTGNIAHAMAKTIKAVECAEFYAVASRNIESAREFAKEFDIPVAYGSYDELINDTETELVYISTIHPLHHELSEKSLCRKKSVLCEKPITINRAQAEDLFRTSKENNVFICEALWTRFFPWIKDVRDLITGGEIGKPVLLDSRFGNRVRSERFYNPELGGGALLDMGIYNITAADLLFGSDFEISDTACILSDTGIDEHNFTMLKYPDGKRAYLTSSINMCLDSKIKVFCERGYIEIFGPSDWGKIKIFDTGGKLIHELEPKRMTGYEFELQSCIDAIKAGKTECGEISHDKTLFIMNVMDELRAAWGMKYPNE